MSIATKLKTVYDGCSDIRAAIKEKDSTKGSGAIGTLADDITALNPKNVVTKIYKDGEGNYGIVQYGIADSLTQIGTISSGEVATTNIPNGASLVAVIYPEQIINVAGNTFQNQSDLHYVNLENIKTFNGDRNFFGADLHGPLNLENAETVGNYCFSGNSNITSVNLPKVTTLVGSGYADGGAFAKCSSLKSANLNDALTSIGNRCFSECSSLGSFTVPSAITKIWSYAFYHCSSLATTLVCPNLVEIERDAFNSAGTIEDINCPNLTTFGYNAFWSSGVKKITNLGSITTLGGGSNTGTAGAFAKCLSLQTVNLPSTLTTIGEGNFYGCTALTNVNFNNAACLIDRGAFRGCTSLATIPGHSNIYRLNDSAFYDCTALAVNIDMPNLTSIADNCFRNSGITDITSLGNITIIGVSNGNGVFRNCTSLTSVVIPSSCTNITRYSFYDCNSLTSVTGGTGVTTIETYAFCNCTLLATISFLAVITNIGGAAFRNCTSLNTTLNLPLVITLGEHALRNTRITSATLNSIETIGQYAFAENPVLTYVDLGSNCTSIAGASFSNCSSLNTVIIRSTVPPTLANASAFSYTSSSLKIYVPNGCASVYGSASNWSSYASKIYELDANGNIPT